MTATDSVPARPSLADTLAVYLKPRVLIVLFLGFSAGLPLALSSSTLLVWMREAGSCSQRLTESVILHAIVVSHKVFGSCVKSPFAHDAPR